MERKLLGPPLYLLFLLLGALLEGDGDLSELQCRVQRQFDQNSQKVKHQLSSPCVKPAWNTCANISLFMIFLFFHVKGPLIGCLILGVAEKLLGQRPGGLVRFQDGKKQTKNNTCQSTCSVALCFLFKDLTIRPAIKAVLISSTIINNPKSL